MAVGWLAIKEEMSQIVSVETIMNEEVKKMTAMVALGCACAFTLAVLCCGGGSVFLRAVGF